MRDKINAEQLRITGVPRKFWGLYLDEVSPLNEEQRSCIEKLFKLERCEAWSVVILGTVGNGKSTLVTSLVQLHEYYHPWEAKYIAMDDLMDKLKEAFDDSRQSPDVNLNRIMRVGLLVIDELNTDNWTDYAKTTIQKILRYRHSEGLPTAVVGNLDADTFKRMFDDHILSRLREGETQMMIADDMRVHGEF